MNSKRVSDKHVEDVEHGLVTHKRSSARFTEESEPSFSLYQVRFQGMAAGQPLPTQMYIVAVFQAVQLSFVLSIQHPSSCIG